MEKLKICSKVGYFKYLLKNVKGKNLGLPKHKSLTSKTLIIIVVVCNYVNNNNNNNSSVNNIVFFFKKEYMMLMHIWTKALKL